MARIRLAQEGSSVRYALLAFGWGIVTALRLGSAPVLLERAGIRSQRLADFFERLEGDGGGIPRHLHLLSTHPGDESCRRRFASGAAAGAPSLGEADWRQLRGVCKERETLVLTGPENGIESGPKAEQVRRV